MAFVDEVTIYAQAGHGGSGVVRWLHIQGNEKAGPGGGDGGRGGDIIFEGVRDLAVLSNYKYEKKFRAEDGGSGDNNHKHGKDGKPIKSMTPYGFRSVAVFDVSQTEGEPVPENPINVTPVDKEIDEKYIDSMRDWITKAGYTYEEEETATDPEKLTGVLGYTSHTQKKVAVDPRLSAAQRAATTAHELAHIHMGHVTAEGAEDYRFHRGRMETEAEGLAYLIMRRAGLNAQEAESFSPGYIAGWSKGDASVVKKAMNSVSTKFNNLMDELKW